MVAPKPFLESAQLLGAVATQYTSPAQVTSIVKKCTLYNTDAVNGYLATIYIVPQGQVAGATYLLIGQRPVGPLQTMDVTEMVNQILSGGDFIAAFADTGAKINMRISGVQVG